MLVTYDIDALLCFESIQKINTYKKSPTMRKSVSFNQKYFSAPGRENTAQLLSWIDTAISSTNC